MGPQGLPGSSDGWSRTGNAGTPSGVHFLGTTDNRPLEFRAQNRRGLKIEPTSSGDTVNSVGGYASNSVSADVIGATIAGGGYSGTGVNRILGSHATIGGGSDQLVTGRHGTVAGGEGNLAGGQHSVVSGGSLNTALGTAATVPGGAFNQASGNRSFAAGFRAKAIHPGSFVWADSTDADFTSTDQNQFLVRAAGGMHLTGNETVSGSLRVDSKGLNNGGVFGVPGITFGTSDSGEGIASKRTPGGNQFDVSLYTGYAPRLTVANNGNVGIGTTNPQHPLHVIGDLKLAKSNGNGGRIFFSDFGGNYIDDEGFSIYAISQSFGLGMVPVGGGARLQLSGDASKTTAGGWLANSDRRIKTHVETVDGHRALDALRAVRPVSFEYSADYLARHPDIRNRTYLNVIAQEFAEIFPDWVRPSGELLPGTDPSDPANQILQVDTWPLTIHSVAAIQELDTGISFLRARQERLESENAALRSQNANLERRLAVIGKLLLSREAATPANANAGGDQ